MLQQAESKGEQPNVNPILQPNHENVQSDTPEEPISELSSNQGGSADEPQLSEAQIAAKEFLNGTDHNYYRPLYNAAQRGDWKKAKSFINRDPNALTARITVSSETALHVAARCSRWGFILKLLELLSPEATAVQDDEGNTVLHYVAEGGSLKTAKALVEKNANLPQIADDNRDLPLTDSIFSGNKELVWYLTLITRVESPSLPKILTYLTQSRFLDIALYFVQRFPESALANNEEGNSLLFSLACEHSDFFSGSNFGFLERWIYNFVHVEILDMEDIIESMELFSVLVPSIQPRSFTNQVLQWFKRLFWEAIAQLAPFIKTVRDSKLKHECAVELVYCVCMQLSSMSFQQIIDFVQDPPILGKAVADGIEEIVRILLQHFPDLIFYEVKDERNILQAAVEFRQEKIVNIIKEISPSTTKVLCSSTMKLEKSTLHLAGKLAPATKLLSVSGMALQMQQELQWFKEVEKLTFPSYRELENDNNHTAKEVFRIAHKELADKGEKWMKDTANSCMVVSALIATVVFAAAFTVPGGYVNDTGIPIFLYVDSFIAFAISDALALFSSLTSLVMFLAILTARYAVEDFLKSLPKKLIIGLGSLFFAIAAMMVAFGATLTIVLSERWQWVSMPITLLASFPVAIFVMLQLPLFIQMLQSTYGSGMFRP